MELIGLMVGVLKKHPDDLYINSILGKILVGLPAELCIMVQHWLKSEHKFEINLLDQAHSVIGSPVCQTPKEALH